MSILTSTDCPLLDSNEEFLDETLFEFNGGLNEFPGANIDFDDLTTTSGLTCESSWSGDNEPFPNEIIVVDEETRMHTQHPDTAIQSPKVAMNDIRRSLPQMYMNILNGGDFEQVQNFSRSFIRPDAVFAARIQSNGQYQLPNFLHGWGPRAHVHYMIGIYVMYPDVAVTFGDTKLITSNQWPGTKLIIPWQCKMTKTRHIPTECWIPTEEAAERMYLEPSVERMMGALSIKDTNSRDGGSKNSKDGVKVKRKRKRSPNVALSHQNRCAPVPVQFVENLQNSAARFPPLAQLTAEGVYTIVLDEHHHITGITLEVAQVGVTSKC